VALRLRLSVDSPDRALEGLRMHLATLEPNPRYRDRGVRPIIRRMRLDGLLVDAISASVQSDAPAREIASFPRLLSAAGVLGSETRIRCQELFEQASDGPLSNLIGLDIIDGRRRPIAFALADALGSGRT
jgi:hypothetical protein